jgi:hypothetical protein
MSPSELRVSHFLTNPYAMEGRHLLQPREEHPELERQHGYVPDLSGKDFLDSHFKYHVILFHPKVGLSDHHLSSVLGITWYYHKCHKCHKCHIKLSSSGYGPQRLIQALGERLWREWSVRSPERSKDCFSTTNNNNNISQLTTVCL